MRVLKNDFSRYNKEDEAIDSEMVRAHLYLLNIHFYSILGEFY